MIKKYNKLIRDRILEIIKAAGERPYWRVLNKKEYLKEIKKKILEEAKELTRAKNKKRGGFKKKLFLIKTEK